MPLPQATIEFRGLFTLARQTSSAIEKNQEIMQVLFPAVAGEPHTSDSHHAHAADTSVHNAILHVHIQAFGPESEVKLGGILEPAPAGLGLIPGYRGFLLSGRQVFAPWAGAAAEQKPVRHEPDEDVSAAEPSSCKFLDASFGPLSRLPKLNTLTESILDPRTIDDPPVGVQVRVALSGGDIACLESKKPLGKAFIEFFDRKGTVVVQPAAEDVEYRIDAPDSQFTIGFRPLVSPQADVTPFSFKVVEKAASVIIQSLPAPDLVLSTNIDPHKSSFLHFLSYYALMKDDGIIPIRRPIIRMCGRCETANGPIKLTVPPFTENQPPNAHGGTAPFAAASAATGTTCGCFAAQVTY